ncbi:MAG: peptidylprolyl isomerase [Breznakia sp.]
MKKRLSLLLCFVFFISACANTKEEKKEEKKETDTQEKTEKKELTSLLQFQETYPDDQPVATIQTDYGEIVIVLFPKQAPKAVENFSTHAKNGYYDGVTFHRIIEDFMIQGGDPKGDGTGGESIWKEGFAEEITYELYHFKGALAMARTSAPSSQGSQFYIVQSANTALAYQYDTIVEEKYAEVGGTSNLDGNYTVFGQTIAGLDVVDAIAKVEKTDEVDASGSKSVAKNPVYIKTITMSTYGEYHKTK